MIKSWTTNGSGITDINGQMNLRGFGGTYDITITDPKTGKIWKRQATVKEQETNQTKIILD
jgi:membrane protease subunit (stomatin/prohibitin family)